MGQDLDFEGALDSYSLRVKCGLPMLDAFGMFTDWRGEKNTWK